MFWYQRSFGRVVGSALQTVRAISKAASYLSEVILLNHPLKQTAYQASNNFITTYIMARLWSFCLTLWGTWKASASRCAALLLSPHSSDLQSSPPLFYFFLTPPPPSSLFPCLSSLNLSSSCRSYASPVLCSAVLITVPFSCLETAEEMWRGREHLLTQSKHWSLLYKVYGKFSSQSKVQFVFQGVVFSC